MITRKTRDQRAGLVRRSEHSFFWITILLLIVYTELAVAVVTTVSPTSGPLTGGNRVTINGTSIGSGSDITAVTLNGVAATILAEQTNNSVIVLASAALASGTGSVVVISTSRGTQTKSSGYAYNPAGSISYVDPSNGTIAGQTPVTIFGTSLGSGSDITAVQLAGVPAVIQSGQTTTRVVVLSGAAVSPGMGNVTLVSTAFGTSNRQSAFTYRAGPDVTAVFPTGGSTAGNLVVTVLGRGYALSL